MKYNLDDPLAFLSKLSSSRSVLLNGFMIFAPLRAGGTLKAKFMYIALESGINVGPMLIHFGFFSRPYILIKGPTLIKILKCFP